jgi:hypothetical protein
MGSVIPGVTQNARDGGNVLQVELIARVIFGNQQRIARIGTDFFYRRQRRLHAQRMKIRIQIVEPAGKQIGIHRRQLVDAIAQIHRPVKRRRMILPLAAKPVFDAYRLRQQLALQCGRRSG